MKLRVKDPCPRCGGNLVVERDREGEEERCLMCGRRPDETPPAPVAQETAPEDAGGEEDAA